MFTASLAEFSPVTQAFFASVFLFLATSAGAACVLLPFTLNRKMIDFSLGGASGVMLAACFWSLLGPAMTESQARSGDAWVGVLIVVAGFLTGSGFIMGCDRILPHLHPGTETPEGFRSTLHRATLLVLAITIHNFPEGLAVGVGFGASSTESLSAVGGTTGLISFGAAIALMCGIALQNFPEGMIVALPIRAEGFSRFHAFFYGMMSGAVQPVAAVLGAWLVTYVQPILPFFMAFAAGAMIYVVVEQLIPEANRNPSENDYGTVGAILGFTFMMLMDNLL